MKEKWDERYSSEEYIYGKEPNLFFKEFIDSIETPGSILLPAEGEGRNAVYAAKKGFNVTAFDFSEKAYQKAMKLAKESGVSINYNINSFQSFESKETFDYIGLFFVHIQEPLRTKFFRLLLTFLNPGGIIFSEVFSKEQINNKTGGPPSTDLLYSVKEIQNIFESEKILKVERIHTDLKEGLLHLGQSDTIRFLITNQ